MSNAHSSGPLRRRRARLVALALGTLPLAACGTVDRTVPTSSIPADFHDRHPVVLANAPEDIDIFPVGASGGLDHRSLRTLQVFAAEYRTSGQGSIVLRAPHGLADDAAVQRTVAEVRRALVGFGVRGNIQIGFYPVADPRLAAPLHLSYIRLQARVASHCGDWPDDLNAGATLHGWENRTYYNLGCATTQTLAAQIDDPRDVLGGRAEDPSDVQLRTRAIGLLRGGADPSTAFPSPTPISPVGAN